MNNKELMEKIAISVRTERFKRKMSQNELAEIADLSINCISNLENAKQYSKITTLNSVANALGMKLEDFWS